MNLFICHVSFVEEKLFYYNSVVVLFYRVFSQAIHANIKILHHSMLSNPWREISAS